MNDPLQGLQPARLMVGLKLWLIGLVALLSALVLLVGDLESLAFVSLLTFYACYLLGAFLFALGSTGLTRLFASLTSALWLLLPFIEFAPSPSNIQLVLFSIGGSFCAFAAMWLCLAYRFGAPRLRSAVTFAFALPAGSALCGALLQWLTRTTNWLFAMTVFSVFTTVLLLGCYLLALILHTIPQIRALHQGTALPRRYAGPLGF